MTVRWIFSEIRKHCRYIYTSSYPCVARVKQSIHAIGKPVTDCMRRKGRYDDAQTVMNMLQNLETSATACMLRWWCRQDARTHNVTRSRYKKYYGVSKHRPGSFIPINREKWEEHDMSMGKVLGDVTNTSTLEFGRNLMMMAHTCLTNQIAASPTMSPYYIVDRAHINHRPDPVSHQ